MPPCSPLSPNRLASFVVMLGLLLMPVLSASAASSDYVLTQRSHRFGDHYTYISPNGFRLTNPRSGFALTTSSNNWNFYLFNDKNKLSYQTSADRWIHEIAGGGERETMIGQWVKQPKPVSLLGMKASEYKLSGPLETRYLNGKPQISQQVVGATYIIAEDRNLPPKMADLFAVSYGVPNVQGLPLELYYTTYNGDRINRLETYRINRTAVAPQFFNMPSGYKPCESFQTVMFDTQMPSQMIAGSQRATH